MAKDMFTLDNVRTIMKVWFPARSFCVSLTLWRHVHSDSFKSERDVYSLTIFTVSGEEVAMHNVYASLSDLLEAAEVFRNAEMGDEVISLDNPAGCLPDQCPACDNNRGNDIERLRDERQAKLDARLKEVFEIHRAELEGMRPRE